MSCAEHCHRHGKEELYTVAGMCSNIAIDYSMLFYDKGSKLQGFQDS